MSTTNNAPRSEALRIHLDAVRALEDIHRALAAAEQPLDEAAISAANRAAEADARNRRVDADKHHRHSCGFVDLHAELFEISARLRDIARRAGVA